jgi:hypothetical protein
MNEPRMLIGCEHSGVVRDAMREAGIDAWSCDILPSDTPSPYHICGDVFDAMQSRDWDAFGFHPDCTFLTVAGIHWNDRGRGWERTVEALRFIEQFRKLAGARRYYIEQPVSILSTRWRKPDQSIQPYQFGEDASKKTCLWLQGFPKLYAHGADRFPGRWVTCSGKRVERWSNQTDSGQNRLGPSADRWKLRSRTYSGVAKAMAKQWAPVILR